MAPVLPLCDRYNHYSTAFVSLTAFSVLMQECREHHYEKGLTVNGRYLFLKRNHQRLLA